MLEIDKEVFDRNLLLTQTYCEMQLANTDKSVAEILRSFNPEYDGKSVVSFSNGKQDIWEVDPLAPGVYDWLFDNQMANKKNLIESVDQTKRVEGSVLVIEIYNTELDGGAAAYSGGLFDPYDLPPIDTWFYSLKSKSTEKLFALIPVKFIELAEEGMAVSLNNCIYWLEDWEIKNDRFIQGTSRYSQPRKNFIQRNPFIIKLIFALSISLIYIWCLSSC
nr:hypothetical protein [Mucilaginibacter sp. L294]